MVRLDRRQYREETLRCGFAQYCRQGIQARRGGALGGHVPRVRTEPHGGARRMVRSCQDLTELQPILKQGREMRR